MMSSAGDTRSICLLDFDDRGLFHGLCLSLCFPLDTGDQHRTSFSYGSLGNLYRTGHGHQGTDWHLGL